MADSLIGYLNQQIQKTNRAQEQQQQSTSTATRVPNANTTLYSSENPTNTSVTQTTNVFRSLEQHRVNPEHSQNIYPQRPSVSDCVSSRGGLGISTIQTGSNTSVVSSAATTAISSSGNVLSIGGGNVYPQSVRNRTRSMLLQQQPLSAQLSTPFTTQSNKQFNMSSSGTMLEIMTFETLDSSL